MNILITLIALIFFGLSLFLIFRLRNLTHQLDSRVQEQTAALLLQTQQLEQALIEQKDIENSLRNQNEYFFALHETTLSLLQRLDLSDLLTEIVRKAALLIGTQHGYLYVIEPKKNVLVMQAGVGIFESDIGREVKRGEGLTGHAWELGMPLSVSNYRAWSGNLSGPDSLYAVITVPLQIQGEILGFIGFAHTREGINFTIEEQTVLERFGALASVALENARLYTIAQHELLERQRVEMDLRHNEEQLRMALNASYVATWELDILNDEIKWSNNVETIFGLPPGTFDGTKTSFQTLIHAEDLAEFNHAREAALDEGIPYNAEYRIIWPDNSIRWLSGQGRVFRNALGKPLKMMGTLLDITERKRNAEEIERWFNLSIDMIGICDTNGHFKRINRTFEHVLGHSQAKFLVTRFREFIHPDDLPTTLEKIKQLNDGKRVTQFENRFRCADGSYKWLSWTAETTTEGNFYAIARDMTQQKKSQEILNQSQQRLSFLIQKAPIAIIEWDMDFRVQEWNQAAEKLLGHSRKNALGQHISFIMPEEHYASIDHLFEQLTIQKSEISCIHENLTANQAHIKCQWHYAPLLDLTDHVVRIITLLEIVR